MSNTTVQDVIARHLRGKGADVRTVGRRVIVWSPVAVLNYNVETSILHVAATNRKHELVLSMTQTDFVRMAKILAGV